MAILNNYCLKCSLYVHCCKFKHSKGFVFVGIKDADKIRRKYNLAYSDFLEFRKFSKQWIKLNKMQPKFSEGYLRCSQLKKDKLLVLRTKRNGDCIFLEKGKCVIYADRPLVCKIYPYWFYNGDKLHIISHDDGCKCKLLKEEYGLAVLPGKELSEMKKIARKIMQEDRYYRKNISRFIKPSCCW